PSASVAVKFSLAFARLRIEPTPPVRALLPIADQNKRGPEVRMRVRCTADAGRDGVVAEAALLARACVGCGAVQQCELGLAQGFGFKCAGFGVAQLIELLDQVFRARVGDGPVL